MPFPHRQQRATRAQVFVLGPGARQVGTTNLSLQPHLLRAYEKPEAYDAGRSRPEMVNLVSRDLSIGSHQDSAFQACLRDQQTIEWVSVVVRPVVPLRTMRDGTYSAGGAGSGNRPSAYLIAISHALADKLRETAGLALRRASGNQGPKQQVPYIQL